MIGVDNFFLNINEQDSQKKNNSSMPQELSSKVLKQHEKNKKIANTQKETRDKRRNQTCRVYTVKIQANKLSRLQKEQLKTLFIEGKWCYNHILSLDDIYSFKDEETSVLHYDKDHNEVTSEYKVLSRSLRQELSKTIKDNIKVLNTRKKRGFKVGKLKYISSLSSINFKQIGVTHKFERMNHIKLQGIKGYLKTNGMDQFWEMYESGYLDIANVHLLSKPDGYYIAITTYIDNDKIIKKKRKPITLCVDMGCGNNFTTSEGEKLKYSVEETERLKRLERKLCKMREKEKEKSSSLVTETPSRVQHSNHYYKVKHLLGIEYQKLSNIKKDLSNKTVAHFMEYESVVIQDEMLPMWHKSHFGKTVQHSILGRVKSELITKECCETSNNQVYVLSKNCPTTRLCTHCGKLLDISLKDRTFKCDCGVIDDRDIHSAKSMIWFYQNNIGLVNKKLGVGRTEIKRGEIRDSIEKFFKENSIEENQ